ncbi:DUF4382 domain-containing protein [Flavobacterium sp. 123]|jgi:hypothetical protein|uniref:DUF4382 domain-containing protein n=1 Tax=Flavobacterium sp. 123 TaxID=2135627 RepID=UPI000EB2C90B|nr:DUF4382 domain-containing protein [Flavobacterium sp. 123]RKT00063.1 uncharacterized protein DUF4382 [Flavobacterium sp. 123]
MKKITILVVLAMMIVSCTQDSNSSGNVTLKASAVATTGKTSLTARSATPTPIVVITDFKVNIGKIKFETDEEDDRHEQDSIHEDLKLVGPFLLDLLNDNTTLSQTIASVEIPNAKYEEIKFKFEPSTVAGEMLGKSFLIKGTINGTEFVVSSSEEADLKMDFLDASKDFTVNGTDLTLNIKIQLDAVIARITALAGQGLLTDTDGDGVIEISTLLGDDEHHDFGEEIKHLLENETHLDDKD